MCLGALKKFYDIKGFDPPKRCLQCRENRKQSKSSAVSNQYRPNSNSHSNAGNESIWGIFKDILKTIFE